MRGSDRVERRRGRSRRAVGSRITRGADGWTGSDGDADGGGCGDAWSGRGRRSRWPCRWGCRWRPRHGRRGRGGHLKVALTSDIDTLNPFLAILASSTGILRFQYESLVQYGNNNEVVPGLASEWQTSPDGKTWTFTIPADRKWSDGEPLTAEDAVWTFDAVKNQEALQQANGGLVTNVARWRAGPADAGDRAELGAGGQPGLGAADRARARLGRRRRGDLRERRGHRRLGPLHHHLLRPEPERPADRQPQLLAGGAEGRGPHLRQLQEHRRRRPGAAHRRGGRRQRPDPGAVRVAEGPGRHRHQLRRRPSLPGDGHQPGRRRRRGQAPRQREPGAAGQGAARGDHDRDRQPDAAGPGAAGARQAGPDRGADRLPGLLRVRARRHPAHLRPGEGQPDAGRRRLRQGRRRHPHRQVRRSRWSCG